jgi:hypothetical protein
MKMSPASILGSSSAVGFSLRPETRKFPFLVLLPVERAPLFIAQTTDNGAQPRRPTRMGAGGCVYDRGRRSFLPFASLSARTTHAGSSLPPFSRLAFRNSHSPRRSRRRSDAVPGSRRSRTKAGGRHRAPPSSPVVRDGQRRSRRDVRRAVEGRGEAARKLDALKFARASESSIRAARGPPTARRPGARGPSTSPPSLSRDAATAPRRRGPATARKTASPTEEVPGLKRFLRGSAFFRRRSEPRYV